MMSCFVQYEMNKNGSTRGMKHAIHSVRTPTLEFRLSHQGVSEPVNRASEQSERDKAKRCGASERSERSERYERTNISSDRVAR